MQKLIAFILSLTFLVQSFNQGFCYLDYIFRKAEYQKHCINKAFPQMHCNGKCQLMKKIMEQEKKEQQQAPEMKYAGKVEVLPAQALCCAEKLSEKKEKVYTIVVPEKPVKTATSIFHPPPAIFA